MKGESYMKDILLRILSFISNRVVILCIVIAAAFIAIYGVLYSTQIVQHEHYSQLQAENQYQEKNVTAERGCIYDRYGRVLAENVEGKTLKYIPSSSNPDLISAIEGVLSILDRNGEEMTLEVEFPIGYEEGRGYFFNDDFTKYSNPIAHDNFLAEVYNTSRDELTEEQLETNATTCMQILCSERFGMDDTYSPEEKIRVASVRYAIFSGRFSPDEPILIAEQISDQTEVMISERAAEYRGFSIDKEFYRVYPEGELFAHIVGYVGRISESELEQKVAEGKPYTEEDYVGKTGIESVFEETLRGTPGVVRTEIDSESGLPVSEVTMSPAVEGNSIFLTIDKDLQQTAYNALVKQIKNLLIDKITGESEPNGKTYSTVDIFCALIDNHFIPSNVLESGVGEYLEIFRDVRDSAADRAVDEVLDLLINTRRPMKDFEIWEKDLYDLMVTNMRDEIHLSYDYQDDPEFYPDYVDGLVAPFDFFQYCLDNSMFDLSVYDIDRDDSDDYIIETIMRTEMENLKELGDFSTFIYSYILSTGYYTEENFMYLLYEQGLISDVDGSMEELIDGEITVIDLLKYKILMDEITPSDVNLDPCSGSVVVSDPDTGEVLAIASYPTFDPNLFMNSPTYYYQIIQDNSGPLSFRATEELRAIGSTFKMASSIAGLDTGVINVNTLIYDDVSFPYSNSDSEPTCMNSFGHGDLDVIHALDYSCNYFFYQVGFLLSEPKPATPDDPPFGPESTRDSEYIFDDGVGLRKLKYYTDLLGLSTSTGIEIPESTPHASELDAVRSAIGQGDGNYSCANLNRYTCTLANGGSVYDLYLVDEIVAGDGQVIYSAAPKLDHKAEISNEYISAVKAGMRLVVTDDHRDDFVFLEEAGVKCAGKTGTAQEKENHPDHALFTGFTNIDDPELAISVMIPFGGGSKYAIPVFTSIAAYCYDVK